MGRQIKVCNNSPYKVTVEDWCDANGITKANYYYRLKKVRQAYLANGIDVEEQTSIVQVPIAKTAIITIYDNSELVESQKLELSVGSYLLKVNSRDCEYMVIELLSESLGSPTFYPHPRPEKENLYPTPLKIARILLVKYNGQ